MIGKIANIGSISKIATIVKFGKIGKINRKRALTAGAALCIAASSGFFMQNSAGLVEPTRPVVKPRVASASAGPGLVAPAEPTAPIVEVTRAETVPFLTVPNAPVLPFADPANGEPVKLAALNTEIMPDPEPDTPVVIADVASCDVGFTATSEPAAMVALTLEAPCYSGQIVDFFHAGLRFSEQTDENGLVRVQVPALEEEALFAATFLDGRTESADILMPTQADYERVALVWKGGTGLGLHALEGGADYGDAGHINAQAPAIPARATKGEGGFMTVLGSAPDGWAADVYSFPSRLMSSDMAPEVSVEAQVLDTTCNATVEGLLLRTEPIGTPTESDLTFAAPGCDAVGEFLVLKNLPQSLKIARN
ncbi:hypothetical protein [Aliiroseovarius subalbicans]|uniref:hypothetical protein n=1 Tax=Aliiroseovarius subalbicans TaxID=2925840 RepID=UPI001F5679AA|nr:hypothetical protein [Aliiroseovarius subalbicans]MCI2400101.1 hypothetical protein [Aliiroseovarius subalbicans]